MSEHLPKSRAHPPLSLTLLPCGAVQREELNDLAAALAERGMLVSIAKEQPIPRAAFKPARQQYRGNDFLNAARAVPGARVLVVTDCDLYADDLNFIFGLADFWGKCAAISLFRLHAAADREQFRRRAAKEAVHELGHTFGLSHCANPRCVMHFSNSLDDTDRKGPDWCEACKRQLQKDPANASLFQPEEG
jgi:archaemetzincin